MQLGKSPLNPQGAEVPFTLGGEFPKYLSPEDTNRQLGRISTLLGQATEEVADVLRVGDCKPRDTLVSSMAVMNGAETITQYTNPDQA